MASLWRPGLPPSLVTRPASVAQPPPLLARPMAPAAQLAAFRASRDIQRGGPIVATIDVAVSRTLAVAAARELQLEQKRAPPLTSLKLLLQVAADTGVVPPSGPCNRLLTDCAQSPSQWPEVWKCYTSAETSGAVLQPETYTALWQAAVQAGWMRQGVELFRRCAAVWGVPSLQAYTTIIARLLAGRRRRRGLPSCQLAHAMWQELRDAHGTHMDGAAVRAGVAALCAVGQVEAASDLMRWASRVGLQAGLGSYNRLIMGHCQRGDMVGAQRVFVRLKALYTPDSVTWNTLAWGYARLGDVVSTRGIMAQAAIMSMEPDAQTWSALIHAYTRANDMEGAEQALTEARECALRAKTAATPIGSNGHNGSSRNSSSSSMNGATASSHATPASTRTRTPCVSAHAYGALVDGYMRQGQTLAAEHVVWRMRHEAGLAPNRAVYNTLIRGHLKLGVTGHSRAFELLDQMRAAGVRPGADTYTMLLVATGEALGGGGWEEGPEVSQDGARAAAASSMQWDAAVPGSRAPHLNGADAARVTGAQLPTPSVAAGPSEDGMTRPQRRQQPAEPEPEPADAAADGAPGTGQGAGQLPLGAAVSRVGQGRLGALMRAMHADGIPADGAVLTTLMMVHARAGRTQLALAVFEELKASPDAAVDVVAWNALAAVHAAAGQLGEAALAAEQAAALAAAQGQGAPEEAFGAVVRGHAALGNLPDTLRALKRFLVLGGRPGKRILDPVIRLCLDKGSTDLAVKVMHAAELTGAELDRERYRRWITEWKQARSSGARASGGNNPGPGQGQGGATNDGLERIKWWLGLANTYYSSEWERRDRREGSGEWAQRQQPPDKPQALVWEAVDHGANNSGGL